MSRFEKLLVALGVVLVMVLVTPPALAGAEESPDSEAPAVVVEADDGEDSVREEYLPDLGYFTETYATLDLEALPSLPKDIKGAFVGDLDGTIIVAGGATDVPESGDLSESTFLDSIYVLPPKPEDEDEVDDWQWEESSARLPEPTAWGASAVSEQGLLCLGGWTSEGVTNRVLRLTAPPEDEPAEVGVSEGAEWSEEDQVWVGQYHLPEPLAFASATVMRDHYDDDIHLYLVGGYRPQAEPEEKPKDTTEVVTVPFDEDEPGTLSDNVYRCLLPQKLEYTGGVLNRIRTLAWYLREDPKERSPDWEVVHNLTSVCRETGRREEVSPLSDGVILPMLAVSYSEWPFKDVLYVIGGLQLSEDDEGFVQRPEAWQFAPGSQTRDGWYAMKDLPADLAVYSAVEVGPSHLLALTEKDATRARTVNEVALSEAANSIFSFHTITETWLDMTGELDIPGGQMFKSDPGLIWLGDRQLGEVVAADDGQTVEEAVTGAVERVALEYDKRHFSWIDFAVIGIYIGLLMWIGMTYARRDRDTDDYFLGGRKIPWWVAGVSIYATGISAISFMAIPARTYALDWSYVALGVFPPILVLIAAYTFVPLLRGLNITTMMEYMEMRFGKSVRTLNTVILVALQLGGRMSVTLLLPALALTAVTGWNIYASVAVMGVLATIYTLVGGISAVIWTDLAQVIVIFGGAILSFVLICFSVDGGFAGVVEIGMDFNKFRSFDFAWDFTVPTFWVFVVWAGADLFGRIGQVGMQRAFSTKDVKSARKSMITMAVLSVPGTLIFYGLGSALFAFYHQNPGDLNPTLSTDAIMPLFVSQQLPIGVAGLVIAGLFAAAMSTLDSGMNVVATVITRDFYDVFRKDSTERERMNVARVLTVLAGIVGTALAMYMASFDLPSLWDAFSRLMGLIGGGFGGVIVLALLTKRANTAGAIVGTIFGTIMMVALETQLFGFRISFFMYGTLSMTICIVTGYLFSLITPTKPKDLTGLTLWTIRKQDKQALET